MPYRTNQLLCILLAGILFSLSVSMVWGAMSVILPNDYLSLGYARNAAAQFSLQLIPKLKTVVPVTVSLGLALMGLTAIMLKKRKGPVPFLLSTVLFGMPLFTLLHEMNNTGYVAAFGWPGGKHLFNGLGCVGLLALCLLAGRFLLPSILWNRSLQILSLVAVAFTLSVAALPTLYLQRTAAAEDGAPNVLIITLDSLRADRLGCYGCKGPTSPNIDAWSRTARLFENAMTTASFTPPTHASLFTGKLVSRHGCYDWTGFPDVNLSLSEIFLEHGYDTFAVSNCWADLLGAVNFKQGFRNAQTISGGAEKVNQRAMDQLRRFLENGRPFFAWLHYYDIHRPYAWSAEDRSFFHPDFPNKSVGDTEDYYLLDKQNELRKKLGPEDLQYMSDRYDAGVRYTDQRIGELFSFMKREGIFGQTLVVLTSDHGESLFEREEAWFVHDACLYKENLNIPLLLWIPNENEGKRLRTPVQIVDIFPTCLHACKIRPSVPLDLGGISLLDAVPENRLRIADDVYYGTFAAVQDRVKVLYANLGWTWPLGENNVKVPHYQRKEEWKGFDLRKDPKEERPGASIFTNKFLPPAYHLREYLKAQNAARTDLKNRKLRDELREQLRALGYL